MLIILLWLKKLRYILKLRNLKLILDSELSNIRIFLVKVTLKTGGEKYLLSILFENYKSIWIFKSKDLNREKITRSFYQKKLFLSKL